MMLFHEDRLEDKPAADVARSQADFLNSHPRLFRWMAWMLRCPLWADTFKTSLTGVTGALDHASRNRDWRLLEASAVHGLRFCREFKAQRGGVFSFFDDPAFTFWMCMEALIDAAETLGDEEAMVRAFWEADTPLTPVEGYMAANALLRLSKWALKRKRAEAAADLARRAIAADITWPDTLVWAARLGVRTRLFDPEAELRNAVAVAPSIAGDLLRDPEFRDDQRLKAAILAARRAARVVGLQP